MVSRTKQTAFLTLLASLLIVATADAQERKRKTLKSQERPRVETRHDSHSKRYEPRPRQYQPGHGSVRYGQRHGYGHRYVQAGVPRKELRQTRVVHYPPRGTVVRHLPAGHRTVVVRDRHYYSHDNVFYLSVGRGPDVRYVVTRPPMGVTVAVLPSTYRVVHYGGRPYYYDDDVYYVEELVEGRPRYVVVEPPIGATIVRLPAQHKIVVVKGRRYYHVDRYYYEPCMLGASVVYRRVSIDID